MTSRKLSPPQSPQTAQPEVKDVDEEPEESKNKRQRVTKESELPVQREDDGDSWTTSLIRTSMVVSLGAASWYFQNMYGKSPATPTLNPSPVPIGKKKAPTQAPVLPVRAPIRTSLIGRSGFVS